MTESPIPTPPVESDEEGPPAFTPVPVTARHDGWTPARQRGFIAALHETGVVSAAAKAVGMSQTAAYNLRKRRGAESFAAAWDIALAMARDRALEVAMHHARHGTTVPRFYRGLFTGTTVHRTETRMLMAALRAMDALARG